MAYGGPAPSGDQSRDRIAKFSAQYRAAKTQHELVASIVDECMEFCCPPRGRPQSASSKRTDRLFDNTAVNALADFASQRVEDAWPTDQKPIDLLPGREIPKNQVEDVRLALADITEEVIVTVNNSDFRASANEMMLDYGVVNGVMLIDEGNALEPLRHRALPFTQAILSVGPYGEHDGLYRPQKVKARLLPVLFPDGKLTNSMTDAAKNNPDTEFEIVEGYYRDWSRPKEEVWKYCCVCESEQHEIDTSEASGIGSKPFVSPSFMRVPGETHGRGPAQLVLPDIKSVNIIQELLLEHLDLSIGGLWNYEDHGTMNLDTIQVQAGTVYPQMAGTKGLQPIEPGGNPQFGAVEREALQQSIERGFFKLDLGPTDKTPKSATEILQRVADRAGRLSGPNSRLVSEFLFPYVRRVLYILRKMGRIKLPRLDGGFISIRPLAPITRAQAQDDILRHVRLLEFLNQGLGPQITNMVIDGLKLGGYLAGKMGAEPNILRSSLEQQALAKAMAELAATAAVQGKEAA